MKQRNPVYINIIVVAVILMIVFQLIVEDYTFLTNNYFWGTLLISVILVFIHNSIGDLIENEKFAKLNDLEKQEYLVDKQTPYLKGLYQSAFKKQSVTEEKDILIDHGFDGIMELDNQLPKWWLGLFYFGTVFCIVYMLFYWTTDFAHQLPEYDQEYKLQTAAVAEYIQNTPQADLTTALFAEDNVEEGKAIFTTNCVSCHGEGGKGGIGPNLTDNHWINQPEETLFKNVFHMVQNGSPNNPAMQAFGNNGVILGNDIQKVAAYVYHINQEQAPITIADGGAAPQGEIANWKK